MNPDQWSIWIRAARLRAFPLALSCIGMGGFLAYEKGKLDVMILVWAMITTLLLQLTSNFANDLGDTLHGADHGDRQGPSRAVQTGQISLRQMRLAVYSTAALSMVAGLALVFQGVNTYKDAVIFTGLGILAILAAIGYTMGKKPYGYLGLGDLSVFIFFGWVGVIGSYYLQAHELTPDILLPASACAFFAVAVLNINNIRDIDSDRSAGKHTLASILGKRWSRVYHLLLLTLGLMCAILYTLLMDGNWWYLVILPMVFFNGFQTYRRQSATQLDPLVKQMALTSLLFVVLFGLSIL